MAEEVALEVPPVDTPPDTAEPAPAPSLSGARGGGRRVLALWLPAPSRRRLIDADLDIVEDAADDPDLILASTRGPAALRQSIRALVASTPVVVVCHPGGEAIAAELVAFGACAVVAEGSEGNAARILDGEGSSHLIDAYRNGTDRSCPDGSSMSVDPITGLAATSGFELHLAEAGNDGETPRLGLIDLGLDGAIRQIGTSGHAATKRRLAVAIAGASAHRGVEVFDLGTRLALLAPGMPPPVAMALGNEIVAIGGTFTPNGAPLELAVGWAGPEAASDPATLLLLAERALEVARGRGSRVVGAEELSQNSSGSIELTVALGVADAVDALDSRGGHSVRVSALAADLAHGLQLEAGQIAEIGLAARLHDVGKAVFGADAFDPASERYGVATADHPERGEKFVLPGAGSTVAAIVRAHHERWDGTGFPDGRAGGDIPMGARIVAVAHRYDQLVEAGAGPDRIAQELRSEGGQTLDPDLVEAAITLFSLG